MTRRHSMCCIHRFPSVSSFSGRSGFANSLGSGPVAEVDYDLVEWNHANMRAAQDSPLVCRIATCCGDSAPGQLFLKSCQSGRVARISAPRRRALQSDFLLFSIGHFIRVGAAPPDRCWSGGGMKRDL